MAQFSFFLKLEGKNPVSLPPFRSQNFTPTLWLTSREYRSAEKKLFPLQKKLAPTYVFTYVGMGIAHRHRTRCQW